MKAKPSLLLLTAMVAGAAALANGVSAASGGQETRPASTRLGNSIAQELDANSAEAAKRKRALDLREQAAAAAEARLKAEVESARRPGGGPEGQPEDPEEARFEDLARIYQAMKPAKAAVVFEQLGMEVQVRVARKMRERSMATILGYMTPRGAAALSMALARNDSEIVSGPVRRPVSPR